MDKSRKAEVIEAVTNLPDLSAFLSDLSKEHLNYRSIVQQWVSRHELRQLRITFAELLEVAKILKEASDITIDIKGAEDRGKAKAARTQADIDDAEADQAEAKLREAQAEKELADLGKPSPKAKEPQTSEKELEAIDDHIDKIERDFATRVENKTNGNPREQWSPEEEDWYKLEKGIVDDKIDDLRRDRAKYL